MKKRFWTVFLTLLVGFALFLTSCADVKNGTTETTDEKSTETESGQSTEVDLDEGQNEIADTSETYTSISEAATALVASITDDQKNTALPEDCITGTYAIEAAGNYYFTGELEGSITVAKNAGDVQRASTCRQHRAADI